MPDVRHTVIQKIINYNGVYLRVEIKLTYQVYEHITTDFVIEYLFHVKQFSVRNITLHED